MTDNELNEGAGLGRRTLIKRAGIVSAGVAAWSTPMVVSLASKAYAVGSPTTSCKTCGSNGDTCFGQGFCGDSGPAGCYCGTNVDGSGCSCYQNGFCVDFQVCASAADCPSGFVCVRTCCPEPLCIPSCDNANGVEVGNHGPDEPMAGPR